VTGAIDGSSLLQLVWAAPLAVLSVTVAWGLVMRGTIGAIEARRDGRTVRAGMLVLVAVVGTALFAAAVAFGLLIMISKD
jgi:hypothetical protein